MSDYLAPLLLMIVLFVGFGLLHRNGQNARGCAGSGGCSGGCSDKRGCSNKEKAGHP
jgi:hypothetical protein